MTMKLYREEDVSAIADAIRGKTGGTDTYTVAQMAQAVTDIPSGGGGWTEELIWENPDPTQEQSKGISIGTKSRINEYEGLKFVIRSSTTNATEKIAIAFHNNSFNGCAINPFSAATARQITSGATDVFINACRYVGGTNYSNNNVIVVAVYGIKQS